MRSFRLSLFILPYIAIFVDAWCVGIRRIPLDRLSKTEDELLVVLRRRKNQFLCTERDHDGDGSSLLTFGTPVSPSFRMSDRQTRGSSLRKMIALSMSALLLLTIAAPTTAAFASSPYNPQSVIAPTLLQQLQWSCRMITAAGLGALIGQERSGHPAGVRTMALVSMGAAMFTLCSLHGFGSRADPSRMAANVASGVGFIGAGVITTSSSSKVHGLTTAAAIWLSAAVGVGCASGLALMSSLSSVLTVTILRIGKKLSKADVKDNLIEQGKAIFLSKAKDASWIRNSTDSGESFRRP